MSQNSKSNIFPKRLIIIFCSKWCVDSPWDTLNVHNSNRKLKENTKIVQIWTCFSFKLLPHCLSFIFSNLYFVSVGFEELFSFSNEIWCEKSILCYYCHPGYRSVYERGNAQLLPRIDSAHIRTYILVMTCKSNNSDCCAAVMRSN